MRELRRCDFCGGDAAGAFEIVPPELEPSEGEQRRVVLCPDCKDRLQTLIEPLLARASAAADDEPSAAATEGAGGTDRRADETDSRDDGDGDRPDASESEAETVVASADQATRERSADSSPDPDATVSDGTAEESEARSASERSDEAAKKDADGDSAETDDIAAKEDAGDAETASGSILEDGITVERTASAEAESESESEPREEPDEPTDSDDERSSGEETSGSAGRDVANRPPAAYGKVLRLLRNREFPMQRSAVESLASGAYDLESREVDAIIDHAIERGEFAEKRGELRRPES